VVFIRALPGEGGKKKNSLLLHGNGEGSNGGGHATPSLRLRQRKKKREKTRSVVSSVIPQPRKRKGKKRGDQKELDPTKRLFRKEKNEATLDCSLSWVEEETSDCLRQKERRERNPLQFVP